MPIDTSLAQPHLATCVVVTNIFHSEYACVTIGALYCECAQTIVVQILTDV